jgi:hypothetical protein
MGYIVGCCLGEQESGTGLDERSRDLIEVLFLNFSGETREEHRSFSLSSAPTGIKILHFPNRKLNVTATPGISVLLT